MSLDPYQPCPCGSGKKIKFCCSKDITGELDKLLDVLDSDQRVAGLNQLDKLIRSKGERAALLALKADVQIELGELEGAETTVNAFLDKHSDNPVALAQAAVLQAVKGDDDNAAVTKLQRAVESVGEQIPVSVYTAFGVIGRVLLSHGNVLAARRHLLIRASLDASEDPRAAQLLMQIHSSAEVPMLLKEEFVYAERPDDVAWGKDFDAALQLAAGAAWLAAAEKLTMLAFRARKEPSIFKNIAILRSWLGDTEATVAAWRSYSERDGVPLDEAIRAEAMAQLLDRQTEDETIDVVSLEYPLQDTDAVMERVLSDRRASKMPVDPGELKTDDDEPPPKAAFWLLDRELPTSGEGLTRDSMPVVLGEIYLFGKQTDRDARLVFTTPRTHDFESKTAALVEILGDHSGPPVAEEVTGQVSSLSTAMTPRWRMPDDTPRELREQLVVEQRRASLLEEWPDQPLALLAGKTPREAAAEPANHVRVLAAILLMDLSSEARGIEEMDFNELRRKLDLPLRDEIDPDSVNVSVLSLTDLSRLAVAKLSDDDLAESYVRAARSHASTATRRLALEVVGRDSLDGKVDKAEAYHLLANLTRDNGQALTYVEKAREAAVAGGDSSAPWLLAELNLRLLRGVPEQCAELIRTIKRKYSNEPEIAQGLYDTLLRFGLITADGRAVGSGPAPETAAAEPPAPASAIWTPDSEPAPVEAGEEKSKLWVPGMD